MVYPAGKQQITAVLHATVDRSPKLHEWCRTWRGPLSIALFIRPGDDADDVIKTVVASPHCARHADLHLVVPADTAPDPLEHNPGDMFSHYPFNVVRNAALDGATTSHVFLLDADLTLEPPVSATSFAAVISPHIPSLGDAAATTPATLWVVPAFETVSKAVPVPRTFPALVAALQVHSATAFYGHHCVPCHHPSDILRWVSGPNTTYAAHFVPGYEPYVVALRAGLPRYDTRFKGRGWDKMSFFLDCAVAGAEFVVLPPPHFLIHAGRGDVPSEAGHTEEYMARQRANSELWRRFRRERGVLLGGDVAAEEAHAAVYAK